MPSVLFHSETSSFKLKGVNRIRLWLNEVAKHHNGRIKAIQFVFCDDAYLLTMNQEYLQHDTLTDIITFRYQEHPLPLESDIYISVERVQENANTFGVSMEHELYRVMVHGVLHLLGFKDKTQADKQIMRKAEEEAIALLSV